MGSLIAPPSRPVAPQTARATGPHPSVSLLWPPLFRGRAAGQVRLPTLLVRFWLLTLVLVLTPRDAASPSPAVFLTTASAVVAPAVSAWACALLLAAVLAALVRLDLSMIDPE